MYLTTLKIVYATVANKHYYAVANNINATNTLDYFEASDFTVDCNLGGQPVPMGSDFAPVACSALSIRGSHIRYRRIRAINFGTQGVPECFAMIAGWAHPAVTEIVDCVIEDCVLEQPSLNNTHETTIIGFGAAEDDSGVYSYPRACVIRNCLVDCEYKVNPVSISGISISGGIATVATRVAHGRSDGDWLVITGALVNGSDKNTYNGSYQISVNPSFPSQFTYTPVAYGGLPVPTTNPTGDMWVGKFSSHYVSTSTPTKSGTGPWTVKLVTATPHFRVPGNNVVVSNVATSPASPNAFNGSFLVADTANFDPVTLEFVFSTDPGGPSASPSALIGVEFHGAQADGGTASVVEGNRIYNCRLGNYGDTGSTKDSIVRNNHFRAVASGPLRNLGRTNPLKTGVFLTRGGADNKTATFTTQAAHGLEVGQAVRIQNAHIGGSAVPDDGQTYNGFLAVDSVPTSTSFTYRMINAPAADADTTPSANLPTFATLWQVGLIVIENNLIELIPSINNWGAPVGVQFYQPFPTGTQFVFRKAIIRNNVIRLADGASDPLQFVLGIRLWNCESAIVEDNVVDLGAPNPIRHYNSKSVKYFNNRTSSGALLQGAEEDIDLNVIRILSELTNDIEGALLLSM